MLPKSLKQWREHQLAPRESERCPASPGVLEPRIAIFQGVTMMQLRNYMEQARVETRGSIKRRPFGFTCRMCLDKQKIHQNPKHRSYSCLRQFAYRWKLLVAMFVIALKSTYYTEWHRWWPLGGVPHLRDPFWIHLFHGLEVCEGLDFTQNCFQDQCAPVDQSSWLDWRWRWRRCLTRPWNPMGCRHEAYWHVNFNKCT